MDVPQLEWLDGLDGWIRPPMEVKPCDFISKVIGGPEHYELPHSRDKTIAVQRALSALEAAVQKTIATHEGNLEAIAHNRMMRDRLTAIMRRAGIADEFSEYRTRSSRHTRKEWIKSRAGYLSDLARIFPISDGYDTAIKRRDQLIEYINTYSKKAEAEKAATVAAAEAAMARRQSDLDLVRLIDRYGLKLEADWSDVLEAIRKKDKYLDLAVAGIQTRGDWSEGFWRVENALGRFKIETDTDKEIAAALCGCLGNDDRDGRIFRDIKWNYDAILKLVQNKSLVEDAMKAMEHIDR